MSENIRIVRIFIGSPGGLADERQIAHEVVDSVNNSHSEHWGIIFKLLGWERIVPGFNRPQSKINEDLDRCDYFIGVLWNNWGSRTSVDPDGYTSGFEEEYYRAAQRIEEGLMKDMALFFKKVEVPAGLEPGEAIRKVQEFRQRCIDEKKVFFKDFVDGASFKDLVRAKLEAIGWEEAGRRSVDLSAGQVSTADAPEQVADETNSSKLVDEGGRKFLEALAQKPREWAQTASHEVARLRLIASALGRAGNDEYYVGNHDANLLLREYRDAELSRQELMALIDCGIVGFRSQNVPVWRWLAKDRDGIWARPSLLSVVGNTRERLGSLELLSLGNQPIPEFLEIFDKAQALAVWFNEDTNNQVFEGAISFLSQTASESDIGLIEAAAENALPSRAPKIQEAVAAILSRVDINAALARLVQSQSDKVEPTLVDRIFDDSQSIKTETIVQCLSAKSDALRLKAVATLYDRKEILPETARLLLTDSNHEIRLYAAESFKRLGMELEDNQVKAALRRVRPSLSIGFRGNETDSTYYDRYQSNRLRELDISSLRQRAKQAGVFDGEELGAIYTKFGAKVADEMRAGLQDGFKSHFDKKLREGIEAGYIDADMELRTRNLEQFSRERITNIALSALCKLLNDDDINVVRSVVDSGKVEATSEIIQYFWKYGEWEDVVRIRNLGEIGIFGRSIFDAADTKFVRLKAQAILSIGKDRVADVLALDAPNDLRLEIAKLLPRRVIRELRDEVLVSQLTDKHDEFRVAIALRCVECLSKARVTKLFERYDKSADQRYYNSIHWLDLGVSLPNSIAKMIADRALAKI